MATGLDWVIRMPENPQKEVNEETFVVMSKLAYLLYEEKSKNTKNKASQMGLRGVK